MCRYEVSQKKIQEIKIKLWAVSILTSLSKVLEMNSQTNLYIF